MSDRPDAALRTLTFGDLDGAVWGVAWSMGEQTSILLSAGSDSAITSGALVGSSPADDWTLSGEGFELSVAPDGEAATLGAEQGDLGGFDQLCRVTGSIAIGERREVECLGRRAARTDRLDAERFESARDVSAWFGAGAGLALLAIRPRRAKGHERDVVSASVFEDGRPMALSDPRLSTTYTAAGVPTRANLELWLADEEGSEYPRRAAGDATASDTELRLDGFELSAVPFRWHSAGRDGAGVYVLARAG